MSTLRQSHLRSKFVMSFLCPLEMLDPAGERAAEGARANGTPWLSRRNNVSCLQCRF